jgi:hypothetical protein
MLCPKCRKPMSVLRKKGSDQVYYYCRAHYCPWLRDPCTYNRFVPGTWDNEIWEEIYAMLSNDAWLEQQLATELSQSADLEKLIRMEQFKISQAKLRVSKYRRGGRRVSTHRRKSRRNLPSTVKPLPGQNQKLGDFVVKWRTGVSALARLSCYGRN